LHVATCVWNWKHGLLPHEHESFCAQQMGPVHSLCLGVPSTVRQKQPPALALHSIGLHEHSRPTPGQPFGAQQMVSRYAAGLHAKSLPPPLYLHEHAALSSSSGSLQLVSDEPANATQTPPHFSVTHLASAKRPAPFAISAQL
jgi:hypothetical protein